MTSAHAQDVYLAIADPTRRRIIELLARAERTVGEITARFAVSISAISQHLTVLRQAGVVAMRRDGRTHRYRLRHEPLNEVARWVATHTTFWDGRMAALRAQVEDKP
jgi:DNA-binding transcriptional ArsR family regulator